MILEGVITMTLLQTTRARKCISEQRNAKYHFSNLLCTDYNRS
jgi:hypothetical protein